MLQHPRPYLRGGGGGVHAAAVTLLPEHPVLNDALHQGVLGVHEPQAGDVGASVAEVLQLHRVQVLRRRGLAGEEEETTPVTTSR